MELAIGTLGTIGGIVAAVLIFFLAWRLVARARAGNRRVREARHDPHSADRSRARRDGTHRDVPQ